MGDEVGKIVGAVMRRTYEGNLLSPMTCYFWLVFGSCF